MLDRATDHRNHLMPQLRLALILLALFALGIGSHQAVADTRLKSIARVKGQEENTIQGMGLVLGLKGTGDGGTFLPEIRALARMLQLAGAPLGEKGAMELKDVKNVALVMVTATIPASGARQGDKLNCRIMSIGAAKSLAGGYLFMAPLTGPPPGNRVYGFASGNLTIEGNVPTTATINGGCRLEEDFFNPYLQNGKFTLVLDQHHADFGIAQDIADRINLESPIQSEEELMARALDQVNIEVAVPKAYRNDPVLFISTILNLPIRDLDSAATVVINERTGSIVIGEDVEIGSVVVTHKNVVIEAGGEQNAERFTAMFPRTREEESPARVAKLRALAEALNAVKLPTEDVIDIIKGLERSGKLHGRLVVQ
jgi:flagellar P-ring protein precursor FlgI